MKALFFVCSILLLGIVFYVYSTGNVSQNNTYEKHQRVFSATTHSTAQLEKKDTLKKVVVRVPAEVRIETPFVAKKEKAPSTDFLAAARAYGAYTLTTNEQVAGKNTAALLPIASITKLMTAVVSKEWMDSELSLTVPAEALVYTSTQRLVVGEEMAMQDLLLLLLAESSNEAAVTIEHAFPEGGFVEKMNEKALELGMLRTHFRDASGSSEENVSTVEDLVRLAQYIAREHPDIFALTKAFGEVGTFANLENYNHCAGNPQCVGVKVGKTLAAQETMLGVFVEEESSTGVLVYVVLGSSAGQQALEALRAPNTSS